MSAIRANRIFRHSVLAVSLCFLAVLFAVEAKIALYTPSDGPGCDIRSAKGRPAEIPEVALHGISAPESAHPLMSFAFVSTLAGGMILPARSIFGRDLAHQPLPVSAAAFFSPHLFLRPPPIR